MARELSDFSVVVNLDGWFVRGAPTYYKGQEFTGDDITERMVVCLESCETFRDRKNDMRETPVLTLRGGKPEDLRASFVEREARKEVESKIQKEELVKKAEADAEAKEKMKAKIEAEMKAKAAVETEAKPKPKPKAKTEEAEKPKRKPRKPS